MDGQNSKALGQQLMDAMEKTIALQKTTAELKKRRQLSVLRKRLSTEAGRLIDAKLDAAAIEYQAAAAGLKEACDLVDKGIRDVNSIQSAIDAFADAADLVAKVAVV